MADIQKRILVLAIRAIGDVVLVTPILRLLRKTFPSAYIAVLVDGGGAQVLEGNPHVDRIIGINRLMAKGKPWVLRFKDWWALVRDLRNENFNLSVDLFSGPRSGVLAYLSTRGRRYGEDFRSRLRGFLYTHPVKVPRDGAHLVEQKLSLVAPLIGPVSRQEAFLEVNVTQADLAKARKYFCEESGRHRKRIGLVPGAGSVWRMWPLERFAELADRLVEKYQANIILLGGGADVSRCQKIRVRMTSPVLDLSGKTSLKELLAVMADLDLVISNDTGPLHLASALSKPKVIGLYGEANTIQYAPWGPNARMLTKGFTENGYWFKVDYERDYDFLLQITVDDVLKMVEEILPVCEEKR